MPRRFCQAGLTGLTGLLGDMAGQRPRPGGRGDITAGRRTQPNQLFELTLEPAAGSPLDRPTGPILYIGRAVRML